MEYCSACKLKLEQGHGPPCWDCMSRSKAMTRCGMTELPDVVGDQFGTRVSGLCVCKDCGQSYHDHPLFVLEKG